MSTVRSAMMDRPLSDKSRQRTANAGEGQPTCMVARWSRPLRRAMRRPGASGAVGSSRGGSANGLPQLAQLLSGDTSVGQPLPHSKHVPCD
jgi:hypothetical protein